MGREEGGAFSLRWRSPVEGQGDGLADRKWVYFWPLVNYFGLSSLRAIVIAKRRDAQMEMWVCSTNVGALFKIWLVIISVKSNAHVCRNCDSFLNPGHPDSSHLLTASDFIIRQQLDHTLLRWHRYSKEIEQSAQGRVIFIKLLITGSFSFLFSPVLFLPWCSSHLTMLLTLLSNSGLNGYSSLRFLSSRDYGEC